MHHLFSRGPTIFAAMLVPVAFALPAAQASTFGGLSAYENDDYVDLVAEASGGAIYYEDGGVTERIRFRDTDADGDGAYGVALHQPWEYHCNPGGTCYMQWWGVKEDQTNRYGTAYGWRISYMHEEKYGVSRWQTKPKVCADQGGEPDACGVGSYQEP